MTTGRGSEVSSESSQSAQQALHALLSRLRFGWPNENGHAASCQEAIAEQV